MKKTKNIIGILALAALVVGVIIVSLKAPSVSAPSTDSGETATGNGTPTPAASVYTLADVAKHPDATSCWTTIDGRVYDLTAWVGQHPGGEGAILSICGHDGTSAFMGQHGDNRRANETLASFMIGTLAQ